MVSLPSSLTYESTQAELAVPSCKNTVKTAAYLAILLATAKCNDGVHTRRQQPNFRMVCDRGICHQPQEQDNESYDSSQLRLQTFQVRQNPQRHDEHYSAKSRDNDRDEAIDFPV
jgi:hypothetical protein